MTQTFPPQFWEMADSSNTDFAQHSPLLVGPTEVGGENEEHGASKSHGSGVVCSVNFLL